MIKEYSVNGCCRNKPRIQLTGPALSSTLQFIKSVGGGIWEDRGRLNSLRYKNTSNHFKKTYSTLSVRAILLLERSLMRTEFAGSFLMQLMPKYSISYAQHMVYIWFKLDLGSPGALQLVLVVKNPPANAGDIRDTGSIPGSGRSPREGNGSPL